MKDIAEPELDLGCLARRKRFIHHELGAPTCRTFF
jgi:hypothetical protein